MGAPNRLNYPEDDRPESPWRDPHAPGRRLNEVPDALAQRRRMRSFVIATLVLILLVLFGVAVFEAALRQSGPAQQKVPAKTAAPPGMFLRI
ncbi:MAG TPA: hypothetical protein VFU76_03700 [Terriglobales bacterium]|nr:hypothetical protein [Terriglobales bacterium]